MTYNPHGKDCLSAIIDGVPDYLHRLALMERPKIPTPEKQVIKTDVMGRLGSYYQEYAYQDMEIKLTFNYLEDIYDYQAFKQTFYVIRKWLLNAKKLELSDDPNVYYVVQRVSIDDAENDIIEYGEFDVTFVIKPFGRYHEDIPIIVNNPTTFNILNNSVQESYPRIIITPTQNTAELVINEYRYAFKDLEVGRELTIDSEMMICYVVQPTGDLLDRSNRMETMEYPLLPEEVSTFTCTNISKIQIFRNGLL